MIELDLTAPHFKPGKPNYERVKWCLSGRLDMEADFVISWTYNGRLNVASAGVKHSLLHHKHLLVLECHFLLQLLVFAGVNFCWCDQNSKNLYLYFVKELL